MKSLAPVEQLGGGCNCGEIRYLFNGKPGKVAFCHCDSCRNATGAVVTVAVMGLKNQLEFIGTEPTLYQSSENTQRGFCPVCGTPICWLGIWHGENQVFIYAGTLDDIALVTPDRHAFTEKQVPWLNVNDHLAGFELSSPAKLD